MPIQFRILILIININNYNCHGPFSLPNKYKLHSRIELREYFSQPCYTLQIQINLWVYITSSMFDCRDSISNT
jgi:hypothetical protein